MPTAPLANSGLAMPRLATLICSPACAVFAVGVVLASVPQLRQALSSTVSSALDGHSATSAASSAAAGGGQGDVYKRQFHYLLERES